MKVIKSILIYVGISLAVLLCLSIILFGIMYFFPSFRIFNVGFVRCNKEIASEVIDVDNYSNYQGINININSKALDVIVVPCEDFDLDSEGKVIDGVYSNKINASLDLQVFGLTSDLIEYNLTSDVEVEKNKLEITYNVTEPTGWISNSRSELVVKVPTNLKYSLNITTEKGNVSLGDKDLRLELNALSFKTNKGELSFTNLCDFEEDEIVWDYLNLDVEYGEVDFSSITNINVNSYTNLKGIKTKFVFTNLFSGIIVNGDNITLNAKIIESDAGFDLVTKTANLSFDKLEAYNSSEVSIITGNCNANITKLMGKSSIVSTSGTIKLNIIEGLCNIESNKSEVEITNAKDNLYITSTSGKVLVKNYEKSGVFVTESGNLDISNNSDLSADIITNITATKGNVKVSNKVNQLSLQTKDSATVDVTFKEIANVSFEHKVVLASNSSGVVYLPTNNHDKPFKFIARGNISGQIAGVGSGTYVTSSDDPQYFPSSSPEIVESAKNNCSFIFNGTINFKGYAG